MADLRGVRLFCSGAAPLDPTLVDRYVELCGKPLLDSYGSTELGNVAFATADNPVATGRPVEGMGVRIADDAGVVLGPNEIGEIEVDSPDLMEGYLDPTAPWPRSPGAGGAPATSAGWTSTATCSSSAASWPCTGWATRSTPSRSRSGSPRPAARRRWSRSRTTGAAARWCSSSRTRPAGAAYWRERICAVLPAYEQPNQVVVLDRLPLNRNGKPDRKALERLAAGPVAEKPLTGAPAEVSV